MNKLLCLVMVSLPFFAGPGCSSGATPSTTFQPEAVMKSGMSIAAETPSGQIRIEAREGFQRKYYWEDCSRSVELWPRTERWQGSLGLYGDIDFDECGGLTGVVAEEGQQHFQTDEEALSWIRSRTFMNYVFSQNGLAIGWSKVPERQQLWVEVWQLVVQGRPAQLPDGQDSNIHVAVGSSAGQQDLSQTLLSAADMGDEQRIKQLLKQGTNVNTKGPDGHTAIMAAAMSGHYSIVKTLISAGASLNMTDRSMRTALHFAVLGHQLRIVQLFMNEKVEVNVNDNDGTSPLILAAMGGYEDIARVLLQHGANPNGKNELGQTALMLAAAHGHLPVVKILLTAHADLAVKDRWGNDAFRYAHQAGYAEVEKLLEPRQ